jgi:2-polyprenyl-3-methyl-5-hydroxy-6-metoxy-1,4-benzoquinol methylase
MPINAQDHYDQVTDAWKEFMGDNLHFGCFETEDMELPQATEMLIEKMLELCDIAKKTRILDVGCGIGGLEQPHPHRNMPTGSPIDARYSRTFSPKVSSGMGCCGR